MNNMAKKGLRSYIRRGKLFKAIRANRDYIIGSLADISKDLRIKVEMNELNDYIVQILSLAGKNIVDEVPTIIVSFFVNNDDIQKENVDYCLSFKILELLSDVIIKGKCFDESYAIWEECNAEIVKIKSYLFKEDLIIHQLDYMITQRCSLKCRDCLNLMQYYKNPINFSKDDLIQELNSLRDSFDVIQQLHILGGEPFMNRDFYDICSYAASMDFIKWVVVFTNATIIPNQDIFKLNNRKIVFYISDYKCDKQRIDEVKTKLKMAGFSCHVQGFSGQWIAHSTFKNNSMDSEKMNELFKRCGGRLCPTVCEGKLFYCEYLANAYMLRGIPESSDNYIDICEPDIIKKRQSIKTYFMSDMAPKGCYYCDRPFNESKKVPAGIQITEPLEYTVL